MYHRIRHEEFQLLPNHRKPTKAHHIIDLFTVTIGVNHATLCKCQNNHPTFFVLKIDEASHMKLG